MGWFDKLFGDLIEEIEWSADDDAILVYRFATNQRDIKAGATLVVRENQLAMLTYQGQIADRFGPGRYELSAAQLPLLSTLIADSDGLGTRFKAEAFYFHTQEYPNLVWSTPYPITLHDAEFGIVQIRASGRYALRVNDPEKLLRERLGNQDRLTIDDILPALATIVVNRLNDFVADREADIINYAAQSALFAEAAQRFIAPDFDAFGLAMAHFDVDQIALPCEIEDHLRRQHQSSKDVTSIGQSTTSHRAHAKAAWLEITGQRSSRATLSAQRVNLRCAGCGHCNDETAKYCSQCGRKLFIDD